MENIIVRIIDFGNSVPAVSTMNEDGSYTIFLNARHTQEQQMNGYIHELQHILKEDFEKHDLVDRLEYYTHGLAG